MAQKIAAPAMDSLPPPILVGVIFFINKRYYPNL